MFLKIILNFEFNKYIDKDNIYLFLKDNSLKIKKKLVQC